MVEEMKKFLRQILLSVDGLLAIIITDRDGVSLLKVSCENTPEMAMKSSFLSTFSMATDQGGKLGIGKNKSVICIYSSHQIVQINKLPMVITFIATSDCNTGNLLSLEENIEPLLKDIKTVFLEQ